MQNKRKLAGPVSLVSLSSTEQETLSLTVNEAGAEQVERP